LLGTLINWLITESRSDTTLCLLCNSKLHIQYMFLSGQIVFRLCIN